MKSKLSFLSMAAMAACTVASAVVSSAVLSPALATDTCRAAKVLTPEIAQSVLGGPVEVSGSGMDDTEVGKTWVSKVHYKKAAEGAKGQVGLLIRHASTKEEASNTFESSKSTFKGVDVAGLGDKAYRTQTPAQLNVLKGSNWLIISAGTFSQPDTAGQEKIAKEILPKITF